MHPLVDAWSCTAPPRRRRCCIEALITCIALAFAACAPDASTVDVAPGTPVVLISIDTLRSDRLPAYGYGGVETPAIDRLREDAILYERAYSHIPLTLPSHSSILTGLLPPEHKVRDNLGYHLDTEGITYLPKLLRAGGYRTGAAVSAYVLRATTGLSEGFEFYDDAVDIVSGESLGGLQRPGRETLRQALDWVDTVRSDPFFLFFHIYEPHTPYAAPEPFASRYADPYDGEVANADAIVGELLSRLREMDVYDEALILLLSDHGESLGEHGQPAHEALIYREAIQVPLILKLPRGARGGSLVERPVQLIDVVPTLADALDFELPGSLRGTSLLAAERPEPSPIYSESYYARLHFGWSEQHSLIDGRFHYLRGPDDEVYDLLEDSAELNDLVRQQRRLADEMSKLVDAISADFESPSEADPETLAKLAALGYLGGSVETSEGDILPDPRDKNEVLAAIASGMELISAGRYAEAVEAFELVVDREPKLVDAWSHLGKARKNIHDLDGSLEAYQRALELSTGAPQVALSAAELYFARGEMDEARNHAELAIASHPVAHDLLAQIAMHEGDLEAASRHVADSMATRGSRVGPLVTQAELWLQEGRYEEALASTQEAEREFGERKDRQVLSGLYFTRGLCLAHLGRYPEASAALQAEIELTPSALGPYSHLAVIHALTGQNAGVGATLRKMVEANPTASAHAEAVRTLRQIGDPDSARALLGIALSQWPQDPELRDLARQPA